MIYIFIFARSLTVPFFFFKVLDRLSLFVYSHFSIFLVIDSFLTNIVRPLLSLYCLSTTSSLVCIRLSVNLVFQPNPSTLCQLELERFQSQVKSSFVTLNSFSTNSHRDTVIFVHRVCFVIHFWIFFLDDLTNSNLDSIPPVNTPWLSWNFLLLF